MKTKRFNFAVVITLITLFLLILAGSIVRTTGSGLGCPDWPHCFGQWIPPTDISQLPIDYKARFAIAGKEIADFDALKTWIEYINRLLGVIVGMQMIWLVITAWPLRKIRPELYRGSVLVLVLTCIQGGIGAKVVSSNLAPHLITVHMVLALVIILLMLSLWIAVRPHRKPLTSRSSLWGKVILALGLVQLVLGTEVRESVDHITNQGVTDRASWLDHDSWLFLTHRSFSLVFMGIFIWWLIQLWKEEPYQTTRTLSISVLVICLLTPVSGMILAYFGMPAFAQPLHLFLATTLLSGIFALIYRPHHAGP